MRLSFFRLCDISFTMSPDGPLSFLINCNRMGVKEPQRVPILQIFQHFETVYISHFLFHSKSFRCLQRASNFFSFFATEWRFKIPKAPPFTILKTFEVGALRAINMAPILAVPACLFKIQRAIQPDAVSC